MSQYLAPQPAHEQAKARASPGQGLFWRSYPKEVPHQQAQVVRARRDKVPFGQLLATAQGRPSQPAVVEHMTEAPLKVFAPFAQQRLATRTLGRPLGAAQGRTMFLTHFPRVSSPGLRIGDDGAHGALLKLRNLLDGKVAFIPAELAAELFQGGLGCDLA